MAEDREILREIWEGKIPVCFALASEEVHSEQPDPIYVSIYVTLCVYEGWTNTHRTCTAENTENLENKFPAVRSAKTKLDNCYPELSGEIV